MKILLLFSALALLSVSKLKAQEFDDRPVHYGVKVDGAFVRLMSSTFGNKGSNENDFGFLAGFFYYKPIGERYFFQPELNYAAKGGSSINNQFSNSTYTGSLESRQDLRYLSLPLLFGVHSAGKELFNFYLGPEISYLLSAKQTVITDTSTYTSKISSIRKIDLSIDFGSEYRIYRGFGADFRYSLGLFNILKPSTEFYNIGTGASQANVKLKNNMFLLGLYYKY